MTLDSIMKCAFRSNTNCQTVGGGESGTNSYIKAVYELSDLVNVRFRNFPYHSEWIFQLSPHGYKYRKACNVAHSHTEEIIRKRKEALKDKKELDRIQAKRNLDFLDILLCARVHHTSSIMLLHYYPPLCHLCNHLTRSLVKMATLAMI
uniref:Cytochrome P450, family 4, subfamily T, polypeptide 8 n=1 Tax=Hucho hucho TaxID=62062 RepID=A0A4W5PUS7_9TELE